MSGKMLVFPQETNSAHVRFTTSRQNLGAVTVCMRYLTDLTRAFSFFSLATPSYSNDFLLLKNPARDEIVLYIRESICGTRDAASGLVQLWVDGKPSAMKLGTYSNITGPMIIVLGQDQDSYGGAFDINQSFVGMITDVHMWDYILSPCHIYNYNQKFNFPTGNILNWNSVEFQITGRVLIQKDQNQC
ncbi:hypothetical protein WMY93_025997 [Mugilogobius chulae]|uniref:Pentraxin (PTX) domain-containing protein n=1 Tax=Mugilogobius chulae TaxID=88201 RepID=A0AAW0N6H6_9GOBI